MKKIKKVQLILLATVFAFLLASCGGGNKTTNNSNDNTTNNTTDIEETNTNNNGTQKELTQEDKIKYIKDEFSKIEKNLSSYKHKTAAYEGGRGEEGAEYWVSIKWEAYYNNGKLVKLIEASGEEGYFGTTSYFYDENEDFFFAFNHLEYDGDPIEEVRVYIREGVVIDALKKTATGNDDPDAFKKAKNKKYEDVISGEYKHMYFEWEKEAKKGFLENVK